MATPSDTISVARSDSIRSTGAASEASDGTVPVFQRWDNVFLENFRPSSCWTFWAYGWEWFLFIITLAVYGADTYTAVILIAYDRWPGQIAPAIPFTISRWLFFACIIFSWLLCFYSAFRGFKILRRGSVAKDYLDPFASSLQSLRSWHRFLVFEAVAKSKKGTTRVALFCHFQYMGAIRTLLAEGPRQAINAITLYSVLRSNLLTSDGHAGASVSQFFTNVRVLAMTQREHAIVLFTMLFTLIIWVFSALSLITAGITYLTYLSHRIPSGNLTRYCKRKIEKRLRRILEATLQKQLERAELRNRQRKEQAVTISLPQSSHRIRRMQALSELAHAPITEKPDDELPEPRLPSLATEPPRPSWPERVLRAARPTSLSTIDSSRRGSPTPLRMLSPSGRRLSGFLRENLEDIEALIPKEHPNEEQNWGSATPAPINIPRKPLPSYAASSTRESTRFPVNPIASPHRQIHGRPGPMTTSRRNEAIAERPSSRRGHRRDDFIPEEPAQHHQRRSGGTAGVPVPPVSPHSRERGGIGGPSTFEAMGL